MRQLCIKKFILFSIFLGYVYSQGQIEVSQELLSDSTLLARQCTRWVDSIEFAQSFVVMDTLHYYDSVLSSYLGIHRAAPYLLAFSLGESYQIIGNMEEAYFWHVEAQKRAEDTWGEQTLPVATSLNGQVFDLIYLGKYPEALKCSQSVLNIRKQHLPPSHSDLAQAYNNLGVLFRLNGSYLDANEQLIEAIKIWENQEPLPVQDICAAYVNAAINYARMGYYQRAIDNYHKVLSYKDSLPEVAKPSMLSQAVVYNNIAVLNRLLGDYGRSLDLYRQAIDLERKQPDPNKRNLSIHYDNIAKVYSALQEHDSTNIFLNRALELKQEIFDHDNILIYDTYFNFGLTYIDQQKYREAIPFLESALEKYRKEFQGDHTRVATLLNNLGKAYAMTGAYDKAIALQEEALDIRQRLMNENSPVIVESHLYLAETKSMLKNGYQEALAQLDSALNIYMPGYDHTRLPDRLPRIRDKQLVLVLGNMGKYFLQKENNDAFQQSWKAYNLAVAAIDSIRNRFRPASSKEQFLKETWPVFHGIMETAWLGFQRTGNKNYIVEAFQASEKSRAMILRESIKHSQAKQYAKIPADMLDEEERLKQLLIFKGRNLNQAIEKNDPEISQIRMEQFALQQSYDSLLSVFETYYPEYYELRYASSRVELSSLQQYLETSQADMIEYFAAKEELFAFILRSDTVHMVKISLQNPLSGWVDSLKSSIYREGRPVDDLQPYSRIASALYQKLMNPVLEIVPDLKERLIIVPGGALGYLPFELLLSKPVENGEIAVKEMPFMGRKHRITYAYAASWLVRPQQLPAGKSNRNLLALAPDFSPDSEWPSRVRNYGKLTYNQREARNVAELMRGKAFLGSDATEEHFKDVAQHYRLIHIASHAAVDDINPLYSHVALLPGNNEDGKLDMAELFGMQLNAELVVLSACETGDGKYMYGEGIMSMAKGFSFAGSQSLITSLWQVNDEATSRLMKYFYQELKKGIPKDEALANARQIYLQESDPLAAHPYYWAGFILTGDPGPVAFPFPLATSLYISLGILLFMALGWVIYRSWQKTA